MAGSGSNRSMPSASGKWPLSESPGRQKDRATLGSCPAEIAPCHWPFAILPASHLGNCGKVPLVCSCRSRRCASTYSWDLPPGVDVSISLQVASCCWCLSMGYRERRVPCPECLSDLLARPASAGYRRPIGTLLPHSPVIILLFLAYGSS